MHKTPSPSPWITRSPIRRWTAVISLSLATLAVVLGYEHAVPVPNAAPAVAAAPDVAAATDPSLPALPFAPTAADAQEPQPPTF